MGEEHTPGPLMYERHYQSSAIVPFRVRQAGGQRWGVAWSIDNEADAALFAAAPDMHAALDQCQKALAMMTAPDAIRQSSVTHAFAQAVAAEASARSALEKAGAIHKDPAHD